MKLSYADIVPWGRSFDEYVAMFHLSTDDLKRRILGVSDGPASFNAVMHQQGRDMVSVDPLYRFSADQVRQRIQETYDIVLDQVRQNQDKFVWQAIPSVEALGKIRMEAMEVFCDDLIAGKRQGRYLEGALPQLPFTDRSFDLVLSSHFLFLYSDHLDLDFHLAAARELARLGQEVRIFPLVDYNSQPSPYLEPVMEALGAAGWSCCIEEVPYRFQITGHQMLRIRNDSSGRPENTQ